MNHNFVCALCSKRKFRSLHAYLLHVRQQHWSNTFSCHACVRPDKSNLVLVQYVGDESAAAQFPHGNATKSNGRNYTRTQPSVLAALKASTSGSTSAQRLYQNLVVDGSSSSVPPTAMPRNTEQVRNAMKNQRNKSRLSRDALYNIQNLLLLHSLSPERVKKT